jgi:hypothetical protein
MRRAGAQVRNGAADRAEVPPTIQRGEGGHSASGLENDSDRVFEHHGIGNRMACCRTVSP